MNLNKLMGKLEDYFDLSENKRKKKHDKLLKIISKLDEKKSKLKEKMIIESENDETSNKYQDLQKELEVLSKLIKKARKHDAPE